MREDEGKDLIWEITQAHAGRSLLRHRAQRTRSADCALQQLQPLQRCRSFAEIVPPRFSSTVKSSAEIVSPRFSSTVRRDCASSFLKHRQVKHRDCASSFLKHRQVKRRDCASSFLKHRQVTRSSCQCTGVAICVQGQACTATGATLPVEGCRIAELMVSRARASCPTCGWRGVAWRGVTWQGGWREWMNLQNFSLPTNAEWMSINGCKCLICLAPSR